MSIFIVKKEFTCDEKLERPLYSQKQPLIRRSLIRWQSTKEGEGRENWKAKYNYRRRFFFFFSFMLLSFFLLRHNHNSILVRSSTLDNFLSRERFTD